MFKKLSSKKGFTLVELLIVVVIIGILAVAIAPKFGSSRQAAQNGVRQNDLSQVATALDTYYSVNQTIPASTNGCVGQDLSALVTDNYLPALPKDPVASTGPGKTPVCTAVVGRGYSYKVFDAAKGQYLLMAHAALGPVNDKPGVGCYGVLNASTDTADAYRDDEAQAANDCVDLAPDKIFWVAH